MPFLFCNSKTILLVRVEVQYPRLGLLDNQIPSDFSQQKPQMVDSAFRRGHDISRKRPQSLTVPCIQAMAATSSVRSHKSHEIYSTSEAKSAKRG